MRVLVLGGRGIWETLSFARCVNDNSTLPRLGDGTRLRLVWLACRRITCRAMLTSLASSTNG